MDFVYPKHCIGSFIQCLHPYPRSVEECDVYDVVTCHFLYGRGIGSDDESGANGDDNSSVGLSVIYSATLLHEVHDYK